MRNIFILLMVMLFSASTLANATTWIPEKVRDPINNEHIQVSQPASSGSYIYHWPSKSEQVFWPYIESNWLWFNPRSGYIAFGNDFEEMDGSKKELLRAWLKRNFDPKTLPDSRLELLAWAEKVYSARGMDDEFWCHFYRLMAFETREDMDTHLSYVSKAIPLLSKKLESLENPAKRMETLYLLSEYHRRTGDNVISADYLEQLTRFKVDESFAYFKHYLLDIAKEQRMLSIDLEAAPHP